MKIVLKDARRQILTLMLQRPKQRRTINDIETAANLPHGRVKTITRNLSLAGVLIEYLPKVRTGRGNEKLYKVRVRAAKAHLKLCVPKNERTIVATSTPPADAAFKFMVAVSMGTVIVPEGSYLVPHIGGYRTHDKSVCVSAAAATAMSMVGWTVTL